MSRVDAGLDKAKALGPGHGTVDVKGFLKGLGDDKSYGIEAEVISQINDTWGIYGTGEVGFIGNTFGYGIFGGVKAKW